jgi:guanosine-3',5'-bis(diphosphate) 3'-pyrophosphohydrolase
MSTLERAIAIAAEAHAGQVDKAGAPYILHPLRVMHRVHSAAERIVAVLHDLVEDTPWTLEALEAEGFAPEVLAAVDALTRRDGERYEAFVARAGADPVGRAVKLADLAENMDLTRLATPTARDVERMERYRRAVAQLNGDPAATPPPA